MFLCTNPHMGWLNPICIMIDMTQRFILHMFKIICTHDNVSQKYHFLRKSIISLTKKVLIYFPRCTKGLFPFIVDYMLKVFILN